VTNLFHNSEDDASFISLKPPYFHPCPDCGVVVGGAPNPDTGGSRCARCARNRYVGTTPANDRTSTTALVDRNRERRHNKPRERR
jgi:hypothetical protein